MDNRFVTSWLRGSSLRPGQWVNYSPAEIEAEGNLSVGEIKNEGYTVSLFQLTAKNLTNAPN